jgi:hypothetical protein
LSDRNLSPVYYGITFVYVALVLMLLSIIGIFLVPKLTDSLGIQTVLQILRALSWTILGAAGLSIIGKLLCLGAPSEMPGKWTIFLAVALVLLGAVIHAALFLRIEVILNLLLPLISKAPHLVQNAGIISVIGFALFLIFLRNLATYIDSEENRSLATQSMVLGGLFFVLNLVIVAVASRMAFQDRAVLDYLVIGMGVLGMLFLMRYGRLLTYLRRDLREIMHNDG